MSVTLHSLCHSILPLFHSCTLPFTPSSSLNPVKKPKQSNPTIPPTHPFVATIKFSSFHTVESTIQEGQNLERKRERKEEETLAQRLSQLLFILRFNSFVASLFEYDFILHDITQLPRPLHYHTLGLDRIFHSHTLLLIRLQSYSGPTDCFSYFHRITSSRGSRSYPPGL